MDSLRKSITALFTCLLVVVAIHVLADVEIPDEWYGIWELEVTGTCIDDAPDPCDEVPVETRSWSTVNSSYR